MSCGDQYPVDGGTFNDIHISNPIITGGTASNMEISNIRLTENITMDASVAQQIAQSICEYVKSCVEFPPEQVAAVFRDCAGAAHVPNAQIPTCAEMTTAIETALNLPVSTGQPGYTEGGDIPTTIFGTGREVILGRPTAWLELNGGVIPWFAIV